MSKVVHILYSGLGGHGAVLFALLENKFLDSSDHHVLFIGVEKPRAEYAARCDALGIPWSHVPRTKNESYWSFVIALLKKVAKINPDMIFSHGLAATPSLALYRLFSRRKRFLVLRETQAHHLKSSREWVFLLLANSLFDRIVYLTQEARSGAKEKMRLFHRDEKAVVISNGLDTEYFSRDHAPSSSSIKIGMQSRLQANKDHRTLLEAFNILCKMHPHLKLSLHIAGDGDTLGSLQDYAGSIGLSDRVIFHGMLGQSDLRKFLGNLSIYAHCTHGETMSTAIMQALSMGLPIVASDVWGVSNMIKNGSGILYQPGNASDLADKISTVIADQKLATLLSMRARQDAVENYSNAGLVEKYNQVFSLHA